MRCARPPGSPSTPLHAEAKLLPSLRCSGAGSDPLRDPPLPLNWAGAGSDGRPDWREGEVEEEKEGWAEPCGAGQRVGGRKGSGSGLCALEIFY
ncbi:Hypothetical predicted protein [Podarcis lilfordi]|uniref:Uncharacterized protein n=1 Tax=Podarcis lilfordi TaxID=74358 RepID=A0AA35KM04_9SAUR|nr:Hypothetical predicted protein [Podarcis lilfordi]